MKYVRRRVAILALFVCLITLWVRYAFPLIQSKHLMGNDFLAFYAGGKLAFTPDLYSPDKIREVQERATGMSDPTLQFTRLPYLAALFWPLARLPFPAACAVWQFVSLSALIGFVLLWRPQGPGITVLALAVFVPSMTALLNGQDVNLLLLWLALAFRALRRGDEFEAGLWLSLCVEKYHLFVLLAIVVVVRRMWRTAAGAACGASVILAACFITNGFDWPVRYLGVLRDSKVHPFPFRMPTIHALTAGFVLQTWVEWALVGLVVLSVAWAAWRLPKPAGFAVALLGGPLVAWHAYVADCVILLPAALILFEIFESWFVRVPILLALSPPVLQSLGDHYPGASVAPLALLAAVIALSVYPVPASAELSHGHAENRIDSNRSQRYRNHDLPADIH